MAILEILEAPDPRLKTVSKPVDTFDDQLKILVDDMFETMYAAHGIGLAAIQVGVPLRLLVIDLQPEDPDAEPEPCDHDHGDGHLHHHQPTKREPRVFVNPEILDPSAETKSYQEGCLSVPDIYADVDRPATCRVRWQDLEGNVHEEAMDGLMAVCIQHEMDHLNGVLFIDHLSRLKRSMALKKLQKARQAA
ncbi:peptide deformylase [Alteraurantiacibacter palmitatis]|uniref:Peptide deformylase n=1 Tax=Alteraurantiacibacter palmitatis TaxID=2054628 RepID=A0ABV7E3T7_9SPHN